MNKMALRVLEEMIANCSPNEILLREVSGARVVDCGFEARGSFRVGIYLSRICMAGLAEIEISQREYGDLSIPVVEEVIGDPVLACMASQYAGWSISSGDYRAIGSGPARALARKPRKIYEEIERDLGFKEESDEALIVLEASRPPPGDILKSIARECGVRVHDLTAIVFPLTSIAGSVQVSARIVETAIHSLHQRGVGFSEIKHGSGICPVAPLNPDPSIMMGWVNDAIIYGGEAFLIVEREEDEELEGVVLRSVSSASPSYGKPFYEIFRDSGFDFYRIDPRIFAPARLVVNNARTGRLISAGRINVDMLRRSWSLR